MPFNQILYLVTTLFSIGWLGYVFLAIGIGSILEQAVYHLPAIWRVFRKKQKVLEKLKHLKVSEEIIFKLMVQNNKQVMRKRDFIDALKKGNPEHSEELPSDFFNSCISLQDKELLHYYTDYGFSKVEASDIVWDCIKKRYRKEFNIANKPHKDERPSFSRNDKVG